MTLEDLRSMYFEEGWWWDPAMKPKGRDALHVLEGGRSLLSPQPGTVGYARLFVNEHRSYQPRSRRARGVVDDDEVGQHGQVRVQGRLDSHLGIALQRQRIELGGSGGALPVLVAARGRQEHDDQDAGKSNPSEGN